MRSIKTIIRIILTCVFHVATSFATAQCHIYKSEIHEVATHMMSISQLVDSVRTSAESAAFGANTAVAKSSAKKVEALIGKALSSAKDAVYMASESQYNSEKCGLASVKSYTIAAESSAIDAHEFINEAYINAKKALTAKNLGDISYYMRKYQTNSKKAQESALDASYAAELAHGSCIHM